MWITRSHSAICKLHLNKTPTKLPRDPLDRLELFFLLWGVGGANWQWNLGPCEYQA